MRLIDADALLEELNAAWEDNVLSTLGDAVRIITNAPTVQREGWISVPIDHDADINRFYIPLPAGWEVQTKGGGSSFRICDTKTHERVHVLDERLQPVIEQMAREIHAALSAAPTLKEKG